MSGERIFSQRNVAPDNRDRSRWYGVRPGDIVTLSVFGETTKGLRVIRLHETDNNGCTVRDGRGREFKAVCEWLTVTKQVKDR